MRIWIKVVLTSCVLITIAIFAFNYYNANFAPIADNNLHKIIQEIDIGNSDIISTKYIDDYDTVTPLLSDINVDETQLKNELENMLFTINTIDYERSTLTVGPKPMIVINIVSEEITISFYLFGDTPTLDNLSTLIVVYQDSRSQYDNTLLYLINHDDFVGLYDLFYAE